MALMAKNTVVREKDIMGNCCRSSSQLSEKSLVCVSFNV